MEFLDHTGHIFSIKSYDEEPIGYKFEETPYVFWFNTETSYKLSVNNYYFKPIRFLIPNNEKIKSENKINISIESDIFYLIGSKQIQNLISKNSKFTETINISEDFFVKKLTEEDLCIVDNLEVDLYTGYYNTIYTYEQNSYVQEYHGEIIKQNEKYYGTLNFADITSEEVELNEQQIFVKCDIAPEGKELITKKSYYSLVTFYAVCNASESATWETNILINISEYYNNSNINNDYCPITIGAEVVDECEELIVNGKNMGINLPKEILKSIYQGNFYNDYADERLFALKIKEYLLNFINIKGECGNFKSALNSLKWFGYGNKLNINKLWLTDNTIQKQYLRDWFEITNDTLYSYNSFRNSTAISLSIPINEEAEETTFNFTDDFWGESKPKMVNLFDKTVIEHYDEGDIDFYRGYFDYTFDELGLKLCALKYYYQKYFLPIHLSIHQASLNYKCHINDIKQVIQTYNKITEKPLLTEQIGAKIKFPSTNILYFTHQIHYVDKNYIEFNNTYELGTKYNLDIFYINDTVINIPIKFEYYNKVKLESINNKLLYNGIDYTDIAYVYNSNWYANIIEPSQYYNCHLILVKDGYNIHEVHFDFTQNLLDHDTYFKNFVIHPKTINTVKTGTENKFDINWWLDSNYSIYLLVNGKWWTYNFKVAIPELNIGLGKLEYKYYLPYYKNYITNHSVPQLFSQVYKMNLVKHKETNDYVLNNGDTIINSDFSNVKRTIEFNSFMYHPELVSISNIDFVDDISNYISNENLLYVDNSQVQDNSVFYYIENNGIKYIFNKELNSVLRSTDNSDEFKLEYNSAVITKNKDNTFNIGNLGISTKKNVYDFYYDDLNSEIVNKINEYIENTLEISNFGVTAINTISEINFDYVSWETYDDTVLCNYNYYYYEPAFENSYCKLYGIDDLKNNLAYNIYFIPYYKDNNGKFIPINTIKEMKEGNEAGIKYYWAGGINPINYLYGVHSYCLQYGIVNNWDNQYDSDNFIIKDYIPFTITGTSNDFTKEYFLNNNSLFSGWHARSNVLKEYNDAYWKLINAIHNEYNITNFAIVFSRKLSEENMCLVLCNNSIDNDAHNLPLKSQLNKNIITYIEKYYTNSVNTVNNKYLNRCHLLNIMYYDLSTEMESQIQYEYSINNAINNINIDEFVNLSYENNSAKSTIDLYSFFFNIDGSCILNNGIYNGYNYLYPLKINSLNYDFYLMHDNLIWYVMFISRDTVTDFTNDDLEFKFYNNEKSLIVTRNDNNVQGFIRATTYKKGIKYYYDDIVYDEENNVNIHNFIEITNLTYIINNSDIYYYISVDKYVEIGESTEELVNNYNSNNLYIKTISGAYLHITHVQAKKYNGMLYIYTKVYEKVTDILEYIKYNKKTYYIYSNNNYIEVTDKTYIDTTTNIIYQRKAYKLSYVRSDNKLLVNRLAYVPSNGINHFKEDDIIALNLTNNNKLPFKLSLGSKWKISHISLYNDTDLDVESPNELAIISIGNKNIKYNKGYYNVTCEYSLDDFTQHQYTKHAKFRVD